MSDLRERCIEAGARAIAESRGEHGELIWTRWLLPADAALDAMLDALTNNVDDIPLPFRFAVDPIVAVLCNTGSSE